MKSFKIIKWVFAYSLCFILISANGKYVEKDYLGMPGNKKTYEILEQNDTLSSRELIELVDENGIPIWFGRYFRKIVCDDGLCRMANLWIFWDGVGNYMGFQYDKNNPITKTDHVDFSFEDYTKLHSILSNKASVLRNIEQEDLIDSSYLDGVTGATLLEYKNETVEKAAFTCHILWHTVHGYTYHEIQKIISKRNALSYLTKMFNSDLPAYNIWTINSIKERPHLKKSFVIQVIALIGDKNEYLSKAAIQFIDNSIISGENVQLLLKKYQSLSLQRKLQVISRFSEIKPISDEIELFLLNNILQDDEINPFLISYTYNTISTENLKNKDIVNKIKDISQSENRYIKQISNRILSSVHK